jgi:tetratricopeptide (TPR) repeat protein
VHETVAPPLAATTSAYAPIRRDVELPKRPPQAETCVKFGDYIAGEAAAMDKGSTVQEDMRDRARKAYQQAIDLDPKYLPAYQSLARLYVSMDDFDHAAATFRRALQVEPRNASIWFEMGWTQARHKEWQAAIPSLTRAVDCDPENRHYVNTLGFALACTGQYQASLACFCRHNSEAVAHFQLARLLHYLKQDDQARSCLQAALSRDPNLEAAQALLSQLTAPAPPVRTVGYLEEVPEGAEIQSSAAPPPEMTMPPQYQAPRQPARGMILPPPPGGNWQTGPGR